MLLEHEIFKGITKLFTYNNIISVSGESGTGKTTLALSLVGNCLKDGEQCIWIQASEIFPIKRLEHIFKKHPNKLDYLRDNIYIIPKNHVIHTYQEQHSLIQNLLIESSILPPNLRFIVVDNISHHLRYWITQNEGIKHISKILDDFFEEEIMPLILFCKRNSIVLIFIHEMTFVPNLSCTKPFFYKLFDRLKTIDFILNNGSYGNKKKIRVLLDGGEWEFSYTIEQRGIIFH
ncbi:MAG: hypothetical protein ACFE9Q_11260 [Candidatus Hodarchaeota archaeon]